MKKAKTEIDYMDFLQWLRDYHQSIYKKWIERYKKWKKE